MATYYVRTDGNNSNTGLGSSTALAWATIGKVFASGSVVTGGDIVYIAPGTYTESINVLATSPTSELQIIGNPTSSQFPGVNAGVVKLSAYNSAGTAVVNNNTYLITATSKNYYSFSNLVFESAHTSNVGAVEIITSRYIKFLNCIFRTENTPASGYGSQLRISAPTSQSLDAQITNCYFGPTTAFGIYLTGQSQPSDTTKIQNCFFDGGNAERFILYSITAAITNCTFINAPIAIEQGFGSANAFLTIKNCLFKRCSTAINGTSSVSGVQTYNRFVGCANTVNNIPSSVTSTSTGVFGVDSFESLLFGLNNLQPGTSYDNSPNKSFGNATGAPATDLYGVTWTGTSPDAGSGTYRVITSNPTNIAYNGGLERNASTITIAPASTSQSIEIYLGATGLTVATSGLAAYYVRNQSAPVAITLVTQTPTGAWASGGFAEISSSLVPGVYRLDVPNAAFAVGASDVTIVVRGASGTNGAVLTVTLSSGGLTAAQTAAAVWDEPYTSHTTASTFGARTLKTTVDNRLVDVGTSNHIQSNVHAIVDSTAAASELSGALLHNGTDYISAELLTPVSAATSVHIGPYQLLADGLGADQPLDVNVGTATSIDVQVTDANGTGIDITGATVTAKVYSSAGTLVASYAGTATYADNGRLSFGLTTTVTNTSGTYTVTVTRTTGATDTQIFGPLRLYVRPA
jgi:hypothetical protein